MDASSRSLRHREYFTPTRIRWGMGTLLLCLLILAIVEGVAYSQDRKTVRLAFPSLLSSTLIYVAQDQGYFRDERLEMDLHPFALGRDALSSMLQGTADLAVAYETPTLFSVCEGSPLRIHTIIHSSDRATGILARRDRGINTPEDLAGKRIGLPRHTNAEFVLFQLLKFVHIPYDRVTVVDLAAEDIPQALATGKVDAVSVWSPMLQDVEDRMEGTGKTVLMFSDVYTEQSMLLSRADVPPDPDTIVRVIRALSRAEKFVSSHPQEALRIAQASFPPQDQRAVRESFPRLSFHVGLNRVLVGSLNRTLEWFRNGNIVKCSLKDGEKLIDASALEQADPTAVTFR